MNYTKIYNLIISRRKQNPASGYTENHHIIPKSLGGNDLPPNLVALTAKEHYICHLLLTKIYKDDYRSFGKMLKAFIMMSNCNSSNQQRYISAKLYEEKKIQLSKIQSENQAGINNSQYDSIWISNPNTEETTKIKLIDVIPNEWVIGRNRKWQKCCVCEIQFINQFKKKTCSNDCHSKLKKSKINKEFIDASKHAAAKKRKIVIDDNGRYHQSVSSAAINLSVSYQTILNRIRSKKYIWGSDGN